MIWNLIGTIGGKVLDIVDDVVEDKDAANNLKFQIQKQLIETKSTELEAQAEIVLAEYEEVKGFEAQHLGHTITAVFDPDPVSATGFISVFAEPQEAAEFLTYKRGR